MRHISKYSGLIAGLYAAAAAQGSPILIADQEPRESMPTLPRHRSLKPRNPEVEAAAQAKRDRKAAKRAAALRAASTVDAAP